MIVNILDSDMLMFEDDMRLLLSVRANDRDAMWVCRVGQMSRFIHMSIWELRIAKTHVKKTLLPLLKDAHEGVQAVLNNRDFTRNERPRVGSLLENIKIRIENIELSYLHDSPSGFSKDDNLSTTTRLDTNMEATLSRMALELKKKSYEQMDRIQTKLNVAKVRRLSKRLFAAGTELKSLTEIVQQNPKRIPSYRKRIVSVLARSRKDLHKLYEILLNAGVLQLLDTLRAKRDLTKRAGFMDSLPISEKALIKNLGFDEEQSQIIYSCFTAFENGEAVSLSIILGEYLRELESYVATGEHEQQKKGGSVVVWATSGSKVFIGLSLAGFNLCATAVTEGIVVSYGDAVTSCLCGAAFIVDGSAKVLQHHKRYSPKPKRSDSIIS